MAENVAAKNVRVGDELAGLDDGRIVQFTHILSDSNVCIELEGGERIRRAPDEIVYVERKADSIDAAEDVAEGDEREDDRWDLTEWESLLTAERERRKELELAISALLEFEPLHRSDRLRSKQAWDRVRALAPLPDRGER